MKKQIIKLNANNASCEELELCGIADRAKNSEIFEMIKKLTHRYDPEKAKKQLEEFEEQEQIDADMKTSHNKDCHSEWNWMSRY